MLRVFLTAGILFVASLASAQDYDVVIYGGTSSGVAAAVQVQRMGKRALLIEPGRHLGGLTSGGLGATDIGNKQAIGGIAREFYGRIWNHYQHPDAWTHQTAQEYRSRRQRKGEETMWTFEPHVAEQIMNRLVRESGAKVVFGERLDLKHGVVKQGTDIVQIRMESCRAFRGRRFIDATYEGDLMAGAGASYHIGRESNATYGETLNGVQTRQAIHHQFQPGVDPYIEPGNPSSKLLPGVHGDPPGQEGSGDRRVQAYCFRMCLTDSPTNLIPFTKPTGYDPLRYELLLRNFEAGETRIPWSPTPMPNRKTDTNNNHGFSTDNINMNYEWADGNYASRKRIFQEHLQYQRGLMWTLANHPRVPEEIRREVSRWGNCNDEFPENGGWSHQLYVREARRMISDYVMTQHNCQRDRIADDSIGLAAYGMDSHNTQRYVADDGFVRNEGDVEVGGFPPYPISYRSIVPKPSQCTNLLVPVCLSASHIAYGSIRMEPVFMVLGQSAASAACQSLDENVIVQKVNIRRLQKRLLADKQVLKWSGPIPARIKRINPKSLPGIVLEEDQAEFVGDWLPSTSISGFVGLRYFHDSNEAKGSMFVRFRPMLKTPGTYEVRIAYTPSANRATKVPVTIIHAGGKTEKQIDERAVPPIDHAWISLGTYHFQAGSGPAIVISNADTKGYVVVDAVQLLPTKK